MSHQGFLSLHGCGGAVDRLWGTFSAIFGQNCVGYWGVQADPKYNRGINKSCYKDRKNIYIYSLEIKIKKKWILYGQFCPISIFKVEKK